MNQDSDAKDKVKKSSADQVDRVTQLEEKVGCLEEQWKRALADYDNLKKRVSRERQRVEQSANQALLDKLLFVYDDLCRADENIADPGLEMVREDFWEVLKTEGIKKVKTVGEKFDPDLMDAVDMIAGEENKVVEEVCPGYLYQDRCLRPAKVKVGRGNDS